MSMGMGNCPVVVILAFADVEILSTPVERRIDHVRYSANSTSAKNEVHSLDLLEDRLPFQLRDAAHYTDDGLFAFCMADLTDARIKLVLCTFADRACVEDHDVGQGLVRGHLVTVARQSCHDSLRVRDIHL